MKRYVFDSYAMIAYFKDEAGFFFDPLPVFTDRIPAMNPKTKTANPNMPSSSQFDFGFAAFEAA